MRVSRRPTAGQEVTPVISLHDASFGYADRKVVSDVDLQILPGETVALVGANGSGKSTLVKGLLGLNDHLGGEVDLFGTPIEDFTKRYLLGYVPQRHTLSASVAATVTEIVSTGRLPHQGWLARPSRTDRRIVAEALEVVGLADFARHEVATLSGGQQRRVLIARALAAQPEVLVMDEPTAGVDLANQHVLLQVLRRLVDDGATLLVVTHEIEALRPILRRLVEMRAGRIVRDVPLEPVRPDEGDGAGHTDPHLCDPDHDEGDDPSTRGVPLVPSYPTHPLEVPRA